MLRHFKAWLKDEGATAAIEAGFLFPLLLMILCGTIDTGMGLVQNQKLINSTQTVCDLLTRSASVANTDVNDAIIAGQLAMKPYGTSTLGFDIVSIKFLNVAKTPTEQWRRTTGMTADGNLVSGAAGLGDQNEGVLGVTGKFTFHPMFISYFVATIPMSITAYGRSRKSATGLITCSTGGATCS